MPIRDKIEASVLTVIRQLTAGGHETYLVGGAVRDLMLGIVPKDYDIATSASPEEIKDVFGRKARIIGRRFRLAHVYIGRDYHEVSTFRREPTAEERCARSGDDGVMLWRDNVYGSLQEDAVRRDFTVNAIYYDPIGERGIIDFVGGVDDLQSGRVRAIGEAAVRLQEDPVRMLRALKLCGQYDFQLEPDLEIALRMQSGNILLASTARLFEELLKILRHSRAENTFAILRKYGLLEHYLPSLHAAWDTPAGEFMRAMLSERGRRIAAGPYSNSRVLAMATLAYPLVADQLGSDEPGEMWEHQAGLETPVRDTVSDVFAPYAAPRFLSARTRDIVLMQPRFLGGARKKRLLRHPDYRYGRELFSIIATVTDMGPDILTQWPVFGDASGASRRHDNPGKHVRSSHKKHWDEK